MQKIRISEKEAGQRLDKYLGKYLPYASKSFIYKMLRKKNIVLNKKRAEGMERLEKQDEITLFLSEETIKKFQQTNKEDSEELEKNLVKQVEISIIYEDSHILIINKPAGLLSQKAKKEDISVIEHITAYLLQSHAITSEELKTFRPAICNRLDRNTSGLMISGKTMRGLQEMNALLKERSIDKYYLTIVFGQMKEEMCVKGYLKKDKSHNKACILNEAAEGADYICTKYQPLAWTERFTLLKVKLITGKSHQIRAQLKSLGFPMIGDGKYGDVQINKEMRRKFSLTHHLLHAYEIRFPNLANDLLGLSGKVVYAPLSEEFLKIVKVLFPETVWKEENDKSSII